jgi:hypothetical protein
LVVLAHLRRRWSLRGREEFRFLSSSRRAYSAGFGVFVKVKRLFSTAPEAESPDASSGITERVRWLTLGAAQLDGCTGASDGLASDAGQTLFSVRCLLTWRVAEELESTRHGGVSDGAASDAFDARFQARRAYWTASDTACGAFDEKHWSVRCSLKRPLNFERARHVARSGAPDAAKCV